MSNHNPLWPWSPIVTTLVQLNTAFPLQVLEEEKRERRLDDARDGEHTIGFMPIDGRHRLEPKPTETGMISFGSSLCITSVRED